MGTTFPREFYEAARFQRTCAVCGAAGSFESHHVTSQHRLKKMGRWDVLYDPRNALRLCEGLATNRCHGQFEKRMLAIETAKLTNESICFMWEVLGVAGQNYLERHYTGIDRRYTLHGEGGCPLCQASDDATKVAPRARTAACIEDSAQSEGR